MYANERKRCSESDCVIALKNYNASAVFAAAVAAASSRFSMADAKTCDLNESPFVRSMTC